MEFVLLLAVASLSNIACFFLGAKLGQSVVKEEPIEASTVNPLEAYKEHKRKKEEEAEKNKIDTILRNIDNYDGTGNGQEDVR